MGDQIPAFQGNTVFSSSRFERTTYLSTYLPTYLLTYLLTAWSRVLLEKLTSFQLVMKFCTFYRNRTFSTTLKEPITCPYTGPDQSSPYILSHFLKIHLVIILPSKPGSSKCSFSFSFPHQNPVYTSPLPHTCNMPCLSHSS